ncbi:hypothetical protein ACHAXN_009551 [Cyclotella atomus]
MRRSIILLVLKCHLSSVCSFAPSSPYLNQKLCVPSINGLHHTQTNNSCKNDTSLHVSPSGIDEWPLVSQTAVFFGTYAALAAATAPTIKLIDGVSKSIGMERWRLNVIVTTLPIILGLFYLAAGVRHFANSQAFQDIYPPIGTWGIWYLPGSAEFHVAWTGMVEVLGAVGLLLGAARDILGLEEDGLVNFIKPISAALLFVLTVVVTPANIFMFTHGAVMGDMAPLDTFHVTRFAVQVLLLSLLFTLARDGFFFAWGEELD